MATPVVKLGAIDLNLLAAFDAATQERNVTRAGQRLGLSQPAMSYALTRLRYMLKDDRFIRSPKGMLPTPRAEHFALPVRSALDALQHPLEPTQFNPSEATRSFRVAVDNYSENGYLLHARLVDGGVGTRPMIKLYGAGSTATACWASLWNSSPRAFERRRLKRKVNSSR